MNLKPITDSYTGYLQALAHCYKWADNQTCEDWIDARIREIVEDIELETLNEKGKQEVKK